jgi:myosin-7
MVELINQLLWSYLSRLTDAQDVFLEQERDRMLTHKLITLQKVIRGWHYRKRFSQTKANCITLQKHWRAFIVARQYQTVVRKLSYTALLSFGIS